MNIPTRREFIVTATAALATGCAHHATEPSGPPPRLVGYAVVNKWFAIDEQRLAELLANHGCNFTEIEYVPWFDESGRQGKSIRTDVTAARKFVRAMRKKGIATMISVVNWNGEAQRRAADEWYHAQIGQIIDQIGTERVLLLPVSEPDDKGKSVEWQKYAAGRWPGDLVLNGPGGRGEPTLTGARYVDWHWCEDFKPETIRPRPFINNTDCGRVLNPGPKRAAAMAVIARQANAHFLIYDWDGGKIDEKVIGVVTGLGT